MFPSPKRMFLTKGVGVHRHALTAFEFALRDADIEQQNLVYVSSILPPRCEIVAREAGVELLKPGDIPSACWPGRRPMNSAAIFTPASVWPDRRIRRCTGIYLSYMDSA
jgi:pyruvoyl-dependent arginine decarboxylase